MRKIKKDDEVIVITGKDKGRKGVIVKVIENGKRVIVEGINIVKKHVKDNPRANIQGGILEREAPVHVSNIAIWNPLTSRADRVGFKILEDGRKVRYFKSNNEIIDVIES